MAVAVLIPAFNPDGRLPEFVADLRRTGRFDDILVVDDGSREECGPLFARLAAMPGVTVLHHEANQGKGAALKTGLAHFLHMLPHCQGVVTADADGQHLAHDVVRVARELEGSPDALVIGSRRFAADVPLRSRLGNRFTKYAFWLLVGKKLEDTQSGLRGIPRALAGDLLHLTNAGYAFELQMLIHCKQSCVPVRECPIATVYLEGNRSSHFNPLLDSLRIYCVLLRFVGASLVTAAADYLVFVLALMTGGGLLLAQTLARAAGGTVNYCLARRAVFQSRAPVGASLLKFVLLVIATGFTSYALIRAFLLAFGMNVIAAKVLAELVIYAASFVIQRDVIFQRTSRDRAAIEPAPQEAARLSRAA